jgi:hypothetical protein
VTARARVSLTLLLPLYIALATAVGFADYHSRPYPDLAFTEKIPEILAGRAEPPARYRVLAPYLEDRLARATPWSPVTDWLVFRWVCLFGSLLAGHLYCRSWFSDAYAAAGNLLIMALLPLTFTNSWPNPDQFIELALFTLACACIARGWHEAFLVALAANALNRETSAFLVLLYFLAFPLTRAHLVRTAAAGLLWLAIFVGLRWHFGYVAYNPWQLPQNLGWLIPLPANFPGYKRIYGWFFIVLLAPCFLLALRERRGLPRLVRMAAGVVAPAYLVTSMLFSSTIESRIFTLMLPLLAPAMLFALFPAGSAVGPPRPDAPAL